MLTPGSRSTAAGRNRTSDTLDEWIADGVCRCPDGCLVAPDAWCEHGLASWRLILGELDEEA